MHDGGVGGVKAGGGGGVVTEDELSNISAKGPRDDNVVIIQQEISSQRIR